MRFVLMHASVPAAAAVDRMLGTTARAFAEKLHGHGEGIGLKRVVTTGKPTGLK